MLMMDFRNAYLIGSMIYQSFKKFFTKRFPDWQEENKSSQKVQIGKRNSPNEQKFYACRVENLRNDEEDPQEMIFGLSSTEEINLFMDDPEGEDRIKDYILKVLNNFYAFSLHVTEQRNFNLLKDKILERKKLQKRVTYTMPAYCKILKAWEDNIIKRHNIKRQQLENFIISSSHLKNNPDGELESQVMEKKDENENGNSLKNNNSQLGNFVSQKSEINQSFNESGEQTKKSESNQSFKSGEQRISSSNQDEVGVGLNSNNVEDIDEF